MKKIIIGTLIVFICIFFGISIGYILYQKIENNEPAPEIIKPVPIENSYNTIVYEDIEANLSSKNIIYSSFFDLTPIYDSNSKSNSFTYDEKTIYVNNNKLSFTNDNTTNNQISVYYFYNHYITIIDNKFTIYDNDLKEIHTSTFDDNILYIVNNYIYYGINSCNAKRPDKSIGGATEIYTFNANNNKINHEFNLNNNNLTC